MTENTITCKKCGNTWDQDYYYGPGPLKCGKCGKVAPCSIKGIGKLKIADLGPQPNQWGRCHTCHKMTQNMPGAVCVICATPRYYDMCPRCNSTPDALIQITKPVYNNDASQEYGSKCYDWQEEHKCLICGRRYWITNANY